MLHEWRAARPPADHFRREPRGTCIVAWIKKVRGARDRLPEASNVLFELTKDQICPVAAEISSVREAWFGRQVGESVIAVELRWENGAGRADIIKVLIAKQDLAGWYHRGVVRAQPLSLRTSTPRDHGLPDAVDKSEVFAVVVVLSPGHQLALYLQAIPVARRHHADVRLQCIHVCRIQHQQNMDLISRSAPPPLRRRIAVDIAELTSISRRWHAVDEWRRKTRQRFVRQSEGRESAVSERHLQRAVDVGPRVGGGNVVDLRGQPRSC